METARSRVAATARVNTALLLSNVLPPGDNDPISVRTTFGPPATALSLVLQQMGWRQAGDHVV
jgi:hypothetical protein